MPRPTHCTVPNCTDQVVPNRKYCHTHRNYRTTEQRARKAATRRANKMKEEPSGDSSVQLDDSSTTEQACVLEHDPIEVIAPANGVQQKRLMKMMELLERNDVIGCINLDFDLYLRHGEKIKSLLHQTTPTDFIAHPHLWVYGSPGHGKTALMRYIYPDSYKKDLNNRFFELYNEEAHSHVMLEDLDHENVKVLGVQFLKTICDEAGFPIDRKFKSCNLIRTNVLVTSNHRIQELVADRDGGEMAVRALQRRFTEIRINVLLADLGLALVPVQVRSDLRKNGNNDFVQLFMRWDYERGIPIEEPVPTPEELRETIRELYM